MAAAKFLLSMRSAHSSCFIGASPLFLGMVTTDDLQANSTYIQNLDYVIQVPSGPSAFNYGNVDLIVSLAIKHKCDAVWPGWGHASENFLLAKRLEEEGISFIGPQSDSMVRLGDKVESLLQAQAVGVPCAPWSGEDASNAAECGLYSNEQVLSECSRIGFPVMLKASSGGGGKGIRRVDRLEDCITAYQQIKSEVKDGYIFAMKCLEDCRHIEIQILGDGKGECIALSGRDCSVQRRHQKLIEEGPPPFVAESIMEAMERSAENLCSSVHYRCAGTVEFLYHAESKKYYFLEVNCRLQVEHPVTEKLFDINLPYLQVAIVEGSKPLRALPGLAKESLEAKRGSRHVIACRIVAEDPTNKWLPSSGEVYEIKAPNPVDSFAYFGISSSGSRIHQYADSQFGHVFVQGGTRLEAIVGMNKYLSQLSIVGSLSTNVQFMTSTLLNSSSSFALDGPPTTSWLDSKYSQKSAHSITRILSFSPLPETKSEEIHSTSLALLAVCVHLSTQQFYSAEKEILRWVRRGHRAPHAPSSYSERLVCPGGERISFETLRTGRNSVNVDLVSGGLRTNVSVDWEASSVGSAFTRALMKVEETSVLVSVVMVSGTRIRAQVGRDSPWHQFEIEEDRTKVHAPMNGRLVRWLVGNMQHVSANQRVCEIEAMKMVTVVHSKAAGILVHRVQEGVSFIEGDFLASLESIETTRGSSAAESPMSTVCGSMLDGLTSLRTESKEDSMFDVIDGFTLKAKNERGIDNPSTDGLVKMLKKFSDDEQRCAKYIAIERAVGEEAFALDLIAKASDEDLVTAWRHRTTLGARLRAIESMINSVPDLLPVNVLEEVLEVLDDRLHRTLILTLCCQLRQQNPNSLVLERLRSGSSEDNEETTTDAGNSINQSFEDPIARRRASALEAGSFFIYDLPSMLEEAVKNIWKSLELSAPEQCVECMQLVLSKDGSQLESSNTVQMNSCGMAAWMASIKTPEYPKGRKVVFIGNDVTFQIGTFSVDEDKVYLYASKLARQVLIPRIYFACNSGARLGLCQEVQKLFKVEWIDKTDLSRGFRYLYLTTGDYESVKSFVVAKEAQHPIEGKIFILSDVLGRPNEYIGVENLVWSGAIAGESSLAYQETFTLSYVTGRTVGIGAYIARLCQRIIQKVDSPILLTGYQALNKLIGSDVYQSNDEIGGVGVMFRNGVSHQTVRTDTEGIAAILAWLQFVPATMNGSVPVQTIGLTDPCDRLLEDPGDGGRALVDDSSKLTMFDKGSFVEVQAAWARSVIAGRARIGGIPLGVIVVETRQTHFYQPADPADPHSQTVARAQAGQVWYPDSAYKTAQAIMDFNREKLPLLILANWRGFSGGQRDMFNEILKFGSYIVDAIREYKQPVFVYLPPRAELRGGAWVVVDSRINPDMIEMYADPSARGGVLEPSGTTEIKFRHNALFDLMMRNDDFAKQVALSGKEHEVKPRLLEHYNTVKPTLVQVANTFADMHDTPQRMYHVGAIRGIVEWSHARKFFYGRLKQRLSL